MCYFQVIQPESARHIDRRLCLDTSHSFLWPFCAFISDYLGKAILQSGCLLILKHKVIVVTTAPCSPISSHQPIETYWTAAHGQIKHFTVSHNFNRFFGSMKRKGSKSFALMLRSCPLMWPMKQWPCSLLLTNWSSDMTLFVHVHQSTY